MQFRLMYNIKFKIKELEIEYALNSPIEKKNLIYCGRSEPLIGGVDSDGSPKLWMPMTMAVKESSMVQIKSVWPYRSHGSSGCYCRLIRG